MLGASGLRIVLPTLLYLFVIKGSLSATTHDQKECHNTDVILDCPHFVQNNHGKLTWRCQDKNRSQWIDIASIRHGISKLSPVNTALDGRLAIHPNGSLEISSLNPDDETLYQCIVKQGPRKLHVIKLSVACGKVTKIEREVCIEEDVVLECDAMHRTNPRKLDKVKWHKKTSKVSEDATWLLLVASNNESNSRVNSEFKLHSTLNGSLLLPRGRDESEDTFKCDVTKKGNGRLDKHIIVVKNVKCRKEQTQTTPTKTTANTGAITTSTTIKGTKVPMETSTISSLNPTTAGTTTRKLVTSKGNIKTTRGRDAITTAIPIKNTEVAMETSTSSPAKQTTAQATSVDHVTTTTSSTTSQKKSVTKPTTQSTVVCGGVLNDPVGTFQSPNFPSAYPANSHCKWTISLPQDYAAIDITFNHLHLERDDDCGSDYVAILDELGNRVGCRLCGNHPSPTQIQVRGRVAVVVFKSDSSVQKKGFKLHYKGVKTVGEPDL